MLVIVSPAGGVTNKEFRKYISVTLFPSQSILLQNLISELMCFVLFVCMDCLGCYRHLVKISCQQHLQKYIYWDTWWRVQYSLYLLCIQRCVMSDKCGSRTGEMSAGSSSSASSWLSSISSITSALASATSSLSGRLVFTELTKGCWNTHGKITQNTAQTYCA